MSAIFQFHSNHPAVGSLIHGALEENDWENTKENIRPQSPLVTTLEGQQKGVR